ncbi:MAG: hypothetical protein JWM44_2887, partial [Bacilli bacterium]|nr:hypothetical protein [Bacilli bacterium]
MRRERWIILLVTFLFLCVFGGGWLVYKSNHGGIQTVSVREAELLKVKSVAKVKDKYDVIVVGTDPEGITAAVSAARNGLKTLLVDGKDRQILGGLMTLGWLNTIDMDADHDNNALTADGKRHVLNQGIFSEWYGMIEGDSFDVHTAANAFYDLVRKEKNIDLLMQTKEMQPITESGSNGNKMIKGLTITEQDGKQLKVNAATVIDATQDADIAYAAGVPFTFGREDLGDSQSKMAVTLVFRVKNVTDEVWKQIGKRLNDGTGATGANKMSAWGYSGMRAYQPLDPKLASMRGLNIGRQNDGTILINSLLLYNIDSFDANSRQEAIQQGQKELPYVVDFMKKTYPEFANIELDGTAPELYVRETRHMEGEYRLNIIDLLENKDQWDRIAFGSYESDLQPIDPSDKGTVVLAPDKYAIPFRSIVPLKVDGLLVVGRSASYDTLAHGSARVLPNGMAEGQAA